MLFSLHAKNRTYFIHHPVLVPCEAPHLFVQSNVLTPKLPSDCSVFDRKVQLLKLLKDFITENDLHSYLFVTRTCRSVPYLRHLQPARVIYEQNDDEAGRYPELFLEMSEYAD
jgi:hypothetical protein